MKLERAPFILCCRARDPTESCAAERLETHGGGGVERHTGVEAAVPWPRPLHTGRAWDPVERRAAGGLQTHGGGGGERRTGLEAAVPWPRPHHTGRALDSADKRLAGGIQTHGSAGRERRTGLDGVGASVATGHGIHGCVGGG